MLVTFWPRILANHVVNWCSSHIRLSKRFYLNSNISQLNQCSRINHGTANLFKSFGPIVGVQTFATILLFFQLDNHDLWASHEARAAQNAQFLLDTHRLGLLRLVDGTPEYQKPPLFYWLVASVAWLRNGVVDEVAVRFPCAISGWLTIATVMVYLSRRGRPRAAWIAGLSLTTMHHFVSISRTGRIDIPLTLVMTMAILMAMESRPIFSGVCLAAALMLKGPVGFVLAMSIIVIVRRRFYTAFLIAGVGLALGVPWFFAVGVETDWAYWREFFWHHNLQRATGAAADLATHPVWFYLLRGLIDTLPWSLALPAAIWAAWNRRRDDSELRLGLIWLLVVVGLLSIAQFKRADYLLPAYPAMAIIIGCWAESKTWRTLHGALVGATFAANLGYQLIIVPQDDALLEKRTATDLVRQHVDPGGQIVFFRVEDHLLAWRLGGPIATVREWENLDVWVSQLRPGYILMPTDLVGEWPDRLHNGTLHKVAQIEDRTQRRLPRTWVLMQSLPHGNEPKVVDAP